MRALALSARRHQIQSSREFRRLGTPELIKTAGAEVDRMMTTQEFNSPSPSRRRASKVRGSASIYLLYIFTRESLCVVLQRGP
jgi:hypothetical protein